jgi:hypothetical protein
MRSGKSPPKSTPGVDRSDADGSALFRPAVHESTDLRPRKKYSHALQYWTWTFN